jgi:hypothetical protein
MISQETINGIREVLKDWSRSDVNVLGDVRILVRRIGDVKGNKSFKESMDDLAKMIRDLIDDIQDGEE